MQGIHEIFAEKEYGKYKSYFTKHFNDITIKFHNGYKFTISAKETGSNTGQYELYVKNCEFPPTQPASQNTLILTGTEEP
ncbi:Uncharacterised protein [Chlamydia abortus]|nr:Uncharacterised protein [Chlamydia abortus]